ncbi:GGDEF domain-containing protein [Pseudomaricurvus sp.]|uniref:GGDEF domain-containing protein n=1 Tax=Pseudomaricurvus sp. TaxID=2004510 RepID=UPI003F6A85F9
MPKIDLQHENSKLKQSVQSLLARIEENQRIDRHFQGFEFQLLGCYHLKDVLDILLVDAMKHFNLDDVGLVLVDRDFSLEELMTSLDIGRYENRLQLRHSDDFSLTLYRGDYRVTLGEQDTLTASRLFPNLDQLGSAALLPLVRHNQLLGSLHFASRSHERFSPDKAVDFLQHLAGISAVCLDNSLSNEHLKRQSLYDRLTKVSNRMHFDLEFGKELERSERNGQPLCCLFLDLDHFKQVNDQFGHQMGDICLKQVAAAIRQELRKTDLLARYGGEEFVVLLHSCEQREGLQIAERIREVVDKLKITGRGVVRPTVSIGLACWHPAGNRTHDLSRLGQRLLKCADEAMYEAKEQGRNRVVSKVFCQIVA